MSVPELAIAETAPSSAISTRQRILEALIERASAIRVVDGYQTDAGQALYWGEAPQLGDGDPDEALALVPGETEIRAQQQKVFVLLPVHYHAVAKTALGVLESYRRAEAVLGDLKRAIESDHTLGGLVHEHDFMRGSERTLQREPGDTIVGVAITWFVGFSEEWGAP